MAQLQKCRGVISIAGKPLETIGDFTYFEGPYKIIPTDKIQVLSGQLQVLKEDIVIEPIPNTYGLVKQVGSSLTII